MLERLNSALGRTHKDGATLYKTPLSTIDYYGHDSINAFEMGGVGRDPLTRHLTQNIDWDKRKIEYSFNSLGLRGPEPNYSDDAKMLFVGGSLMHGVGVNEEDTFVHKTAKALNASYINVSDTDSLTELFDEIDDYMDVFKPNYLIISDTRFFDEFGHAWTLFWKSKNKTKEERYILTNELRPILIKRNQKVMELLLYKINNLYKDTTTVFITSNRKDFAFENIISYGTKILYLDNSYFVDLARDNRHGGPDTHTNITHQLLNLLNQRP